MTTLYEGTLGDPSLIYPANSLLEDTVTLTHPATKLKALVRGFELGFATGDRRISSMSINLEVEYGDNPSQVKVHGTTRFRAPSGEFSPTSVVVYYTLVAD